MTAPNSSNGTRIILIIAAVLLICLVCACLASGIALIAYNVQPAANANIHPQAVTREAVIEAEPVGTETPTAGVPLVLTAVPPEEDFCSGTMLLNDPELYLDAIEDLSSDFSDNLFELSDLMQSLASDPAQLSDPNWQDELTLQLQNLDCLAVMLEGLGPAPEAYAAYDHQLKQAAGDYRLAFAYYLTGVQSGDMTQIDQANGHLERATAGMDRANELLSEAQP